MSKSYTYYHDLILPSILGKHGDIYLRGINQKRLFARKRRAYLRRAIVIYIQRRMVTTGVPVIHPREISSLPIEIEFDHFIVSLRSSIEHSMQLINSIAHLGLLPTNRHRNNTADRVVSIDEVINALRSSNDKILIRLGNYLLKEKQADWYKTLHTLRIEMFHNKYDKFIIRDNRLFFGLPDNQQVDLLNYCSEEIDNVERILSYSLRSLCRFKHIQ